MSGVVATVFGSTGFIGRYVVNQLGRIGSQVVLPYRGDGMNTRHLKLMGDLGQIAPVNFDPRDRESIRAAVEGSNVVINLIGSEYETSNYTYQDFNVAIPLVIAEECERAGVERFFHVSASGAALDSPSQFLSSKQLGEDEIRSHFPNTTIFRPTPVFGYEDRLLNRYGSIARHFPIVPLVNEGKQRMQPVYVEDVASAILECLRRPESVGETYELGGADVVSVLEITKAALPEIGKRDDHTMHLPDQIATLIGRIQNYLPVNFRILSSDQVIRAKIDMLLSNDPKYKTLKDLGIKPMSIKPFAPNVFNMYSLKSGLITEGHGGYD